MKPELVGEGEVNDCVKLARNWGRCESRMFMERTTIDSVLRQVCGGFDSSQAAAAALAFPLLNEPMSDALLLVREALTLASTQPPPLNFEARGLAMRAIEALEKLSDAAETATEAGT